MRTGQSTRRIGSLYWAVASTTANALGTQRHMRRSQNCLSSTWIRRRSGSSRQMRGIAGPPSTSQRSTVPWTALSSTTTQAHGSTSLHATERLTLPDGRHPSTRGRSIPTTSSKPSKPVSRAKRSSFPTLERISAGYSRPTPLTTRGLVRGRRLRHHSRAADRCLVRPSDHHLSVQQLGLWNH